MLLVRCCGHLAVCTAAAWNALLLRYTATSVARDAAWLLFAKIAVLLPILQEFAVQGVTRVLHSKQGTSSPTAATIALPLACATYALQAC
jgi:hypothetical protein